MFIDKIKIYVKAGDGGNGAVAWHREKYVSHGGPDGGDGGNGGSIVIKTDPSLNTLLAFRYKRRFVAVNGDNGAGSKYHGKNGDDLTICVPKGTLIKDAATEKIIRDMSDEEPFILCHGGRGGWGNKHFATPTRQVPNFAKSGIPGEEKEVILELKMIADVGLVGLPSAGKSSLLAAVSSARPKIAEYHFTTLEPSLGVVATDDSHGFVMADIPGLIEGASEGLGLGDEFLRHIERCRMLIQVVDISGAEGRTPVEDFNVISSELEKFSPELASRPRIVVGNKADAFISDESELTMLPELSEECRQLELVCAEHGYDIFYISAAAHLGLKPLIEEVGYRLTELPPIKVYEPEVTEADTSVADAMDADISTVHIYRTDDAVFHVEGEWVDRLLGRINFEDRESFMYFDRVLIKYGIIDKLREAGCEEGDTVCVNNIEFDFID